jgi:hypothetical protein
MNWLKTLTRRPARTARPRPPKTPARLEVERMEDRLAPVVGAYTPLPAVPASAFDGVVQVNGGTGSLLSSGRHILTAAHVVDVANIDLNADGKADVGNGIVDSQRFAVQFDTASGPIVITSTAATVHRSWNGNINNGFDLAVLELPVLAPVAADRYDLYRTTDELGKEFTVVGYGASGTGATGHDGRYGVKRRGQNVFDDAQGGGRLVFDFDPFLLLGGGLGDRESNTAPGDSGGPNFIGGRIAGVTSGGVRQDSKFGDTSIAARVSTTFPFIDGIVNQPDDIRLDLSNQNPSAFGNFVEVWRGPGDLWLRVNGVDTAVPLAQVKSLTIVGTTGSDTIAIKDGVIGSGFDISVQASAPLGANVGVDTLIGPTNTWNSWEITSVNKGTLNGSLAFQGVDNLRGGASGDEFIFRSSGYVTGEIRGGYGYPDTLNYTQLTWGVQVDLKNATASAVGGRVFEIENVWGGEGGDTLVGNDIANVLMGNGGDDVLRGLGGEDWLVGGLHNDVLDGGHDYTADHLIGGDGINTFVRHYNRATSYDGQILFWWMEADETDFDAIEDKLSVVFW